ncbi:MAG: DUF2357 domain-containing protein [Clostridia bacterium]|nr:DUF2357 domain-containing protein [Clostridia bacterium]
MAENNEKKKGESTFRKVYDDTTFFIDSIVEEYDVFPAILGMMRDGNATIELKKRYLLRAIDEAWVNIIEDTLPALDTIIRNPSKDIAEREEILPIELSHNISVRSLKHLSQHTNLINKIDGDTIIPSKILNVFRDETLQTYENRFINTLINRLFVFVNRRYEIAKKSGQDEKTTSIEFKDSFDHGKTKVNMNFRLEIAEPTTDDPEDTVERNYSRTTDLWHRVEKLNSIITAYADSEFVHNMGQSFIHPPVMRTNAIMKNKNLYQCLVLWQFIESYESAGYSMIIQEDLENVDDEYIKELYSTLALQYLIFRYNIKNEFNADNTLASSLSDKVISPRIIDDLKAATGEEFDIVSERVPESPAAKRYSTLTPDDRLMLSALEIALDANDIISAEQREDELQHPAVPEPEPAPEYKEYEEPEKPEEEPEQPENKPENTEKEPEKAEEQPKNAPAVKVKIRARQIKRDPVRVTVRQIKNGDEQ